MPYDNPEDMVKAFQVARLKKLCEKKEQKEKKKAELWKTLNFNSSIDWMEEVKKLEQATFQKGMTIEKAQTLTELYFKKMQAESKIAPPFQEADQTPRAWNLITIKRCVVTREEFYYYGSIEAVLMRKKFPVKAPNNGDLLISWFDMNTRTAYYELCRPQDEKEMLKYVREQFQGGVIEEGDERMISLEE